MAAPERDEDCGAGILIWFETSRADVLVSAIVVCGRTTVLGSESLESGPELI